MDDFSTLRRNPTEDQCHMVCLFSINYDLGEFRFRHIISFLFSQSKGKIAIRYSELNIPRKSNISNLLNWISLKHFYLLCGSLKVGRINKLKRHFFLFQRAGNTHKKICLFTGRKPQVIPVTHLWYQSFHQEERVLNLYTEIFVVSFFTYSNSS